jgi:hypothetical protein
MIVKEIAKTLPGTLKYLIIQVKQRNFGNLSRWKGHYVLAKSFNQNTFEFTIYDPNSLDHGTHLG